jgi:hypothetical protein
MKVLGWVLRVLAGVAFGMVVGTVAGLIWGRATHTGVAGNDPLEGAGVLGAGILGWLAGVLLGLITEVAWATLASRRAPRG